MASAYVEINLNALWAQLHYWLIEGRLTVFIYVRLNMIDSFVHFLGSIFNNMIQIYSD